MEISLYFIYGSAYIGLFATCFYVINILMHYQKKSTPKEAIDKKVSILIPAYNEEEGIVRTIKSALSLDYPKENLEIIIIDDGSKDNTYKLAKKFESSKYPIVKVYTKKNGGKASALNFAIEKCSGEIVVSMDADTFVKSDALKKMIGHFYSEEVMCVSPSMVLYNPKGILSRIIQIEYLMGIFLRKSFATINAIHVTPGAFSAYRKKFFEKYGGYQVGNITEDLEVALRIQSKHFVIENASQAVTYTVSPPSFKDLFYQRRRWYVGLMKNLWNYRRLFGFKHGPLGFIVLPVAVSTILLSVGLTVYVGINSLIEIRKEIISFSTINFEFKNYFEMNSYIFERLFYTLFSKPLFLIALLFLSLLAFYIYFSRKQILFKEGIKINFVLYALFYSILFTFWWVISFIYLLTHKTVAWRANYEEPKKK